jgi:hypothetical protein
MTFAAGTTLFEIEKMMINEINIKGDENKGRKYKLNKSKLNVRFASLELLFSDTGTECWHSTRTTSTSRSSGKY